MKLMQSIVNIGNRIVDSELEKMIKFAVSVRDNTDCSARDRMRATELLGTLLGKGVDVAQYLDKAEKLAAGQSTENIVTRVIVEYQDQDQNGRQVEAGPAVKQLPGTEGLTPAREDGRMPA